MESPHPHHIYPNLIPFCLPSVHTANFSPHSPPYILVNLPSILPRSGPIPSCIMKHSTQYMATHSQRAMDARVVMSPTVICYCHTLLVVTATNSARSFCVAHTLSTTSPMMQPETVDYHTHSSTLAHLKIST